MASRTMEARLVISGEDRGASASIAKVVQTVRQLEEVAKISRPLETVAKSLHDIERASKAVDATMGARNGLTQAEAGLKGVQATAQAAATALDQARKARAAFDGVKAAKGSEQAQQIEAATKAVRELSAAHKRAEGDVRKATAAVAAETATLQRAEAAASKLGADLGNLGAHQERLRAATDSATEAVRRQIRAEDQQARAASHHAKERAEFAKHQRTHGAIGAAATAASGYVGVHGVGHVIAEGAKAGAEVQSERVRLEAIRVPSDERRHIEQRSLELAAQYRNVTQSSVMELWKEMRSVMTDPHEVDHIIDPMVRAKSILDAQDKTGTASHGLNLLVKGAESIGAAKNPDRFVKLLDGYIKAMQVMGKTITPEGIYEMQKYSKASGGRWSDRFIMTTAQSLGQEVGGSTAGQSIDVATRQIVGGMQNQHSKARAFAEIGLIDPKNLDVLKTGEIKGVKKGVKHAVAGDTLAATDLDRWVYEVLIPHMRDHGITKEDDQVAWAQTNFTGASGSIIAKLIQQRQSFEAHAKMYEGATGLAGQSLNRDDAIAGLGGLGKSIETFLGVLSSPVMKDAAHTMDAISGGIGQVSLSLEAFNRSHPNIAKAEAPAAAAAGLGAAGLASAAVYRAMTSGFGLTGSAVALDHSAAALTAAAVKLSGPGAGDIPKEAAKGGAPAAAAAFGLGGITVAGGAVAGAYLDSNFGGNPGALGKLTGQEGDAEKSARFKAGQDAERRKGALFGERANLLDNLKREKELRDNLAKPDAPGLLTQGLDALGYGSAEERQKRRDTMKAEADKNVAEMEARLAAIDAKIKAAAAMPLPPVKPPDMSQVEAKATETGQQAGQSIANGVKDKAPEVQEQGLTIFQRLKETFSQGIFVPINLVPGGAGGEGGGSGVQTASFGGGGGFGDLIHRASFGGGTNAGVGGGLGGGGGSALSAAMSGRAGGGNGGGGGGASIGFGSDYHAVVGGKSYRAAYQAGGRERVASWLDFYKRPVNQGGLGMEPDKARAMVAMMQGESGINLNPGAMGDHGTAFGTAQWRLGRARNLMATARGMGLDWRDPRAQQAHMRAEMLGHYGKGGSYRPVYDAIMAARSGEEALALGIDRFENPAKKALAYRFRLPYLHGLRRYSDRGPAIGRDIPRDAAAMDPRLVRGADGKEGLDLGDGTMRMPDGSVRPIPNHIPEPPPGGLGGGGGRGDIGKYVEDFGRHVDRLAGMGFDGRIEVVGLNNAGMRTSGMKVRSRGPLNVDMGVSMPGAKDDPSDWS